MGRITRRPRDRFSLKITLGGDRKKDLEDNVERYARLGIQEYFVLDLKLRRILGYRLNEDRFYEPIVPQEGRWRSRVLGLDLARKQGRVRLHAGSAALPYAEELIAWLGRLIGNMETRHQALADELIAIAEKSERLAAKLRELGTVES